MPIRRMLLVVLVAALARAAVAPAQMAQPAQPAAPVEVTLRPVARAPGPVIRIGNLATVEGGDGRLRALIAGLDVAEFSAGREIAVVGRDALKYRLLIAGIDPRRFQLGGPVRCLVSRGAAAPAASGPGPTAPASPASPGPTAPPEADPNPVVIHARDRVKMIAHVGGGQVIAAGEALQEGRAGQSIRIRNVDSNKMVQGRVLGPGVVAVEY